jgi:hypothetical protein
MNGGGTDPIWQTPSASTAGVQFFNFIIYNDGSTYYAKNCTTGTLDYSNTNFRLLLQSINTALLQADGVRVSLGLKNGTYPLDDEWQPGHATFGANQWLEMIGETRDGVVLLNTFVPTVVDDYHVPISPLCNVRVNNLTMDGGDITGATGSHITFLHSGNTPHTTIVDGCHITRNNMGISSDEKQRHIIACNNYCEKTNQKEYMAFSVDTTLADASINVYGNYFNNQNFLPGGADASGLTFGNGRNIIITGNHFIENFDKWAISVEHINAGPSNPPASTYQDLLIANNFIQNGRIMIGAFDNVNATTKSVTIQGNLFRNGGIEIKGPATASYTNKITYLTIKNNELYEAYGPPIYIERVTGPVDIEGNLIKDSNLSGDAADFGLIQITSISDCTIRDNHMLMLLTGTNQSIYGFHISATTNLRIEDNIIQKTNAGSLVGDFGGHGSTPYIILGRRKGVSTGVTDGATVNHGLPETPLGVIVTPTVASEFASVTAKGATTFTVALKKHDNSAGTSQTIHWEAWY